MTRERLRIIQALLEALIPLLGFFIWEWTLHFVLLFYMLDLVADHLFLHFGARRISLEQKVKGANTLKEGAFAIFLLICALVLIHLALLRIFPNIQLWNSTVAFWSYKEMGIEQGYLLLPLVFLAAQQHYKMEFLMPAHYRTLRLNDHWKKAKMSYVLIAAFAGITIGLTVFVEIPDMVYLLSIVVLSTLYRLLFG